jgi:N-acyl-D-amino-acid deacylase
MRASGVDRPGRPCWASVRDPVSRTPPAAVGAYSRRQFPRRVPRSFRLVWQLDAWPGTKPSWTQSLRWRSTVQIRRDSPASGNQLLGGNVVVDEDRITAVGPDAGESGDVIDVDGLAVAPGFIDMHSHCDLVCMSDPQLAPKLMQGVTLELLGQDGLSEAPIREEDIQFWRRHLSGLNGDPDVPWDWRNFGEYLDRCEGAVTNIAAMVGHGTVRLRAMGMENRLPNLGELEYMRQLVDQSIRQGAIGFSTGLIYSPCVYGDTSELINLGQVVARHGSFMVYHMRYEGEAVLTGMEEVFRIARESGAACHISHFKARGLQAWGQSPGMIDAVEKARGRGLDITADQYPYTAGSTMLAALLPPWAHAEGITTLNRWLRDEMKKAQFRADILYVRDVLVS